MVVLVDSGGSKTNWTILNQGSERDIFTLGMNPYSSNSDQLKNEVAKFKSSLRSDEEIEGLYFYGAGCSEPDKVEMIRNAFTENGITQNLEITHDLVAAGRALFGNGRGIACILGTGSSSCVFNDGLVEEKVMSLGYILGDEGGGMDLGRRLLHSILMQLAPQDIIQAFYKEFDFKPQEILDKVYFEPGAKHFVASFTPFLSNHIELPFCQNLTDLSFRSFIKSNILQYKNCEEYKIGFIGSVGYNFQQVISRLLKEYGLQPATFLKSPMEGLVKYHRSNP